MPTPSKSNHFREMGLAVLKTETNAISVLGERLDESFDHACETMIACDGRVVVIGMGKSGHIAGKIAATLASTGTPAFFVHPGEASHGDLGMITAKDVVLALSNSGTTEEILRIVPLIKRLGVPLITLTGNPDSELARDANINLHVGVDKEACPLGLAPTASTTAALAMGDALAVALLDRRGFTENDFARSHPGGQLGRNLLLHINDIMITGDDIPSVKSGVSFSEAIVEITRAGIGMTAIVDDDNKVLGIFTDGDLRRSFEDKIDLHNTNIDDVMTKNCVTAKAGILAAEGLQMMQKYKINSLPVTDENERLVGALNMHTLLRAGVA
ncbi:MAG: KpsF/GutQ family sugar-phosphate isomerase [Gammaproteobacteria bacterium]|nr:MAG: KpsF/GutQ family sugar-phosphate isomerase [Gammaproteobacteria bacterium]